MQFDHGFAVAAPAEAVWTTITDIERVAPCVPNTRVSGRADPDGFAVEIIAAVGPFEITAAGTIALAERDDAARREVLRIVALDADGDKLAEANVHDRAHRRRRHDRRRGPHRRRARRRRDARRRGHLDQVAGDTLRTFAANLEALLGRAPA